MGSVAGEVVIALQGLQANQGSGVVVSLSIFISLSSTNITLANFDYSSINILIVIFVIYSFSWDPFQIH